MIKKIILLFIVFLVFLSFFISFLAFHTQISSRLYSSEEIYLKIKSSSEADEETTIYIHELARRGKKGIPFLNRILIHYANDIDNTGNYWITGIILLRLYDLAEKDIYIPEEVPVLIYVINKQRVISDTLVAADTLTKITKLDVGYNETFINQYTEKDEAKRQKMISRWKKWYLVRYPYMNSSSIASNP